MAQTRDRFLQTGTGAVARTVDSKMRDTALHVHDFGATGDGITNDSTAIQACVDAANSLSYVEFGAGLTYAIETELDLETNNGKGPRIIGNFATIKATASMTNAVSVTGTTKTKTHIQDLIINGNSLATVGFYGKYLTEADSLVSNLRVINCLGNGIVLDACQLAIFEGLTARSNGAIGIVAESCNAAKFIGTSIFLNTTDGMRIRQGITGFSSGCELIGFHAEVNSGYGLVIEDSTSPVTVSGWIERNEKDGILIMSAARNVDVQRVNVVGAVNDTVYRAIRIQDGALGCTIKNNLFNKNTGQTNAYSVVEDENTSLITLNDIGPNYFGTNNTLALGSRTGYLGEEVKRQQVTTVNVVGKGGYLVGGEVFSVAASGSTTLTFVPTGTFNIAGAADRGVYTVNIKMIGQLVSIDEGVYKEFIVHASTSASTLYNGSSTEVHSLGDSLKSTITMAAPNISGVSGFSVVVSNADNAEYTGYITWEHMMTTKGTLTLTIT